MLPKKATIADYLQNKGLYRPVHLPIIKSDQKWTKKEVEVMKKYLHLKNVQIWAYFPYRSYASVKIKAIRLRKLVQI